MIIYYKICRDMTFHPKNPSNIVSSWLSCLDESISIWFSKFTCPGWMCVSQRNSIHLGLNIIPSVVTIVKQCTQLSKLKENMNQRRSWTLNSLKKSTNNWSSPQTLPTNIWSRDNCCIRFRLLCAQYAAQTERTWSICHCHHQEKETLATRSWWRCIVFTLSWI